MRESSHETTIDLHGLTLVAVAVAWLTGILLSSWLLLPPLIPLPGACVAALLAILLWRRDSQGRFVMLMLFFLLLGAWRYATVSPLNDPQAISAFIGSSKIEVRGTVADEPKLQTKSRLLLIDVSTISKDGGSSWQNADGQLEVLMLGAVFNDPYGPNYGDSVDLQGKLQAPSPQSTPNIFASMAFPRVSVNSSGGNPIIAALYQLRLRLATILMQSLPQPEAALLIAILLGLRTPALKPLEQAFSVTGTAHLIVPSGFKVTILAGIVVGCTQWLYEDRKTQTMHVLPAEQRRRNRLHWLRVGLVILAIGAYTILSGGGPAALRAGMMGILLAIAPRLGRVYNVYTALALTALLMSLLDPFVLWDVGFKLSFLGTLGIVLLTPLFQRALHPLRRVPFAGHYLVEVMAVTLAAEVATWPIIALNFSIVSFIAPVTNALTVPLLGPLITLGVLISGAGLLFAQAGIVLGWAAWPLLWYVSNIVPWCAALPWAYVPFINNLNVGLAWCYYGLLALGVGFVLYKWPVQKPSHAVPPLLSKRAWRLLQIGAALLVIVATGATAVAAQTGGGPLTVTFLSVGPTGQAAQGEAILLHTPDNKNVLIDGGLDASSLAEELDNRLPFWQRSLDMVLLTTPRQDHLTGLLDVVTRYQVGEVLDPGMLHPNTGYALWKRTIIERNIPYQQVRAGMTITVGNQVTLQILWPRQLHKSSNEELDNALIVQVVAPGMRLLLLGAAVYSKYALDGLLTTIDPRYLQANIVQLVGEVGKTFAPALRSILQIAHPSVLVITPAVLSARQRKAGVTSTVLDASSLIPGGASWQVLQTAQPGTFEMSTSPNGLIIG